ncbi:hypothetical protein OHA40_04270 [Nocardia sp. NBC_00508]|uniref:DUF6968 family protein n=1 Tax=Nocardia sp. NBC_00508 TaxID=2975992 RepID=UPI002E81A475|nr:hypothetical protein [Nocardia sp. NBC_00508]WUD67375.1 hypothetical protein OHA40_04270 [Nocardia sp. NBC_00508]
MRAIPARVTGETTTPAVRESEDGGAIANTKWRRIREVIATRTVADAAREVSIEVGKPQMAPGDTGVVCGFRIQGIGERWAHGADSIAALYRAFQEIAAELRQANNLGAHFEVTEPSDPRFPVTPTRPSRAATTAAHEPQALIAARTLRDADSSLSIIIGRPYLAADRRNHLCRFHISEQGASVASGVDEIQALHTAIHLISERLELPPDWPVSRLS